MDDMECIDDGMSETDPEGDESAGDDQLAEMESSDSDDGLAWASACLLDEDGEELPGKSGA
eukprot:5464106-Lingulodinium_polyedra.AAC.1